MSYQVTLQYVVNLAAQLAPAFISKGAASYEFIGSVQTIGNYFVINGQHRQAGGADIVVFANQLSQSLFFRDGLDPFDVITVRDFNHGNVFVNVVLSGESPPVVSNHPPVVSVHDVGTSAQVLAASSLFTVSDPDSDAIVRYQFLDKSDFQTSGHFTLGGAVQSANQTIEVTAAQLSTLIFALGTTSDHLSVRASDGTDWSSWADLTVTPQPTHVSIVATAKSVANLDSVNAGNTATATFTIHVDSSVSATINLVPNAKASSNALNVNFNGKQLVDTQYADDWVLDSNSVVFAPADFTNLDGSADKEVSVSVKKPISIDPEKTYFTLGIDTASNGVVIATDKSVAVGEIRQTVNHPVKAEVTGLDGGDYKDYKTLLTQDFQAALDRIYAAVPGELNTTVNIHVTVGETKDPNHFAETGAVTVPMEFAAYKLWSPSAIEKYGSPIVYVPRSLVAYHTGKDVSLDIDVTINSADIQYIYTGNRDKSTSGVQLGPVDLVPVLTHELLHGFGFGGTAASLPSSAWGTHVDPMYVPAAQQAYSYSLGGGSIFLFSSGLTAGDPWHVGDSSDLMYSGYNGDHMLSANDVAILQDFGYVTRTLKVQTPSSGQTTLIVDHIFDYADTGDGDVTVTGSNLNDIIALGNGNDTVTDGSGNDSIYARDDSSTGRFVIHSGGGDDVVIVAAGNDVIDGSMGNDTIFGNAGDDSINGGQGTNILHGGDGNDTVWAKSGADQLFGDAGNDYLEGGGGGDTYDGGTGIDTASVKLSNAAVTVNLATGIGSGGFATGATFINIENLEGSAFADILTGTAGANEMWGNAGDDSINGGQGNNILHGGDGNDTVWAKSGADQLFGDAGNDYLEGGGGGDTYDGGTGIDTASVKLSNAAVTVNLATGVGSGGFASGATFTNIENVEGSAFADILTGTAGANEMWGSAGDDSINGAQGNNILHGGDGNDTVWAKTGADVLFGDAGNDYLEGGGGGDSYDGGTGVDTASVKLSTAAVVVNLTTGLGSGGFATGATFVNIENVEGSAYADLLTGDGNANLLVGNAGNDVLEGKGGNDTLTDTGGNNLFNGGTGEDALTGAAGNELYIGGAGNDTVTTNTGADIIAFNRGDGQDTIVASTGTDNAISLGGGIKNADLTFTRSGNDLVLGEGGVGEQLTLKDWYNGATNKSVLNLQLIEEASADFNAGSADPLVNKKVERYDFQGLVTRYDQAGAPNAWALSNALLDMHLAGSDTDAIGGDLAYRYGLTGSLTGIALTPAQGILADPGFGSAPQALQPLNQLQTGVVKLS